MHCPKCGKSNSNDSKFCQECGFSLNTIFQIDNSSDNIIKYQIDEVRLDDKKGSIFITQNYFLFIKKYTILSDASLGIAGGAVGVLLGGVYEKIRDGISNLKSEREPLTEAELVKLSKKENIEIKKILRIEIVKKSYGVILAVLTEEYPKFRIFKIPKEIPNNISVFLKKSLRNT